MKKTKVCLTQEQVIREICKGWDNESIFIQAQHIFFLSLDATGSMLCIWKKNIHSNYLRQAIQAKCWHRRWCEWNTESLFTCYGSLVRALPWKLIVICWWLIRKTKAKSICQYRHEWQGRISIEWDTRSNQKGFGHDVETRKKNGLIPFSLVQLEQFFNKVLWKNKTWRYWLS